MTYLKPLRSAAGMAGWRWEEMLKREEVGKIAVGILPFRQMIYKEPGQGGGEELLQGKHLMIFSKL